MDLATKFIPLPIMMLWAWFSPSVWALVSGGLAAAAARMILTHTWLPGPRMLWSWRRDHLSEIAQFGKWINIASAATFFGSQGDRIILGFLLTPTTFGVYAIGKLIVDSALGIFERLNANLSLPVLSEVIRNNPNDLKDRYYRFRLPFDVLSPLISGFLVSAGVLVINVMYDGRYAAAGHMVQILAISLLIFPSSLIGSAFTANGEPRVGAIVAVIQALAAIICVLFGYWIGGTLGAIWGTALHKFLPVAAILGIGQWRGWLSVLKELRVSITFVAGIALGEIALVAAKAAGIS